MSTWPAERPMRLEPFRWIDEETRRDHWCLERNDHCMFLGEYLVGGGRAAGPVNRLILDFKRAPPRLMASPHGAAMHSHKRRAIEEVAAALRRGFGRAAIESLLTFVPLPTSRPASDARCCDRLRLALERAFAGTSADVRPLLKLTAGVTPDHERGGRRLRRRELLGLIELDCAQLERPLRPIVALFDDVLTSGKHLSVAKTRIRERFPTHPIIAVFVARVVRASAEPADEGERA